MLLIMLSGQESKCSNNQTIPTVLIVFNKIIRIVLNNDNRDTRDYSLFIARKKWALTILRPLLELCAKEDSILAMKICSLAMVLTKRISDRTMKQIQNAKKSAKKISSLEKAKLNLQNEEDSRSETEITSVLINAKEQTAALLSFKEAFCSGNLNLHS